MSNVIITAIVRRETPHSFLLEVNGVEHWVSRRYCRYKSVPNGELSIPAWLAKKWGSYTGNDLAELTHELTLPSTISIIPKPNQSHQQAAFEKLHNLSVFALFMQVRAGKTKVAIDVLCNHAENSVINRVLWFCPLSVVETAKEEWKKFAVRELAVEFIGLETVSGCSRERFEKDTQSMATDCAIIIDESHMIKNGRSVRMKRLSPLFEVAPIKGILSGTPITRNVDDLYHQIYALDWRIFGYRTWYQFRDNHLIMSEKYPGLVYDTKHVDYLSDRLKPFVFEWFDDYTARRSNNTITVDMSEPQQEMYAKIKEVIIERLSNFTEKPGDIFLLFTALASVMSGYISARVMQSLFGEDANEYYLPCPKIKALLKYLSKDTENTIIWCSRRHDLELLSKSIPQAFVVSGAVKPKERHRRLQDFRQSKDGILIAMVQVARRGINLSECNNVVYYSHSFDYEAREQSQARTLLPTKYEVCYYTDMIYDNGLDARILQSHDKKSNIISAFLDLLKTDRKKALSEIKRL